MNGLIQSDSIPGAGHPCDARLASGVRADVMKAPRCPSSLPSSHRDYFFVLAAPRSGSTWLQQTLNAHPNVTCLFEPSNTRHYRLFQRFASAFDVYDVMDSAGTVEQPLKARLPLRFNYGMARLDGKLRSTATRLTGAKITWQQLFRHFDPTAFFIRYRDARHVLLYRSCVVDALCSWMIAKRTQLWNSETRRHMKLEPFAVNVERAEYYIHRHLLYLELMRTSLRAMAIHHIELTYEDLMGDTKDTLSRIAAFVGIEAIREYSRLQKLVLRPYVEIITNYDELVDIENAVRKRIQDNGSST